ncbi:MAG TPA: flagellin, partial [Candidatus Blautia stercoravium]|nr:flagellin [Candidatus Blautia stercoravium]
LQKEISSLKDEIDRIADSTNFNGINLLDGSLQSGKLPTFTGLNGLTPTEVAATSNASEFTLSGSTGIGAGDKLSMTVTYADANGKAQEKTITLTAKSGTELLDEQGNSYSITSDGAPTNAELGKAFAAAVGNDSELSGLFTIKDNGSGKLTFSAKETGSNSNVKVLSAKTSFSASAKDTAADLSVSNTKGSDKKITYDFNGFKVGEEFTINGQKFAFATADMVKEGKFGDDVNLVMTTADPNPDATAVGAMADVIANKLGISSDMVADSGTSITFSSTADNGGLTLQIGDTADSFNQMKVSVGDMHTKALGIADIDISTQAGAQAAVDKIKSAINSVSSTRGDLGAIQNRLEHTINNLSVSSENMTPAESRIRDVDMANEMMAYTKNNILVQSSQAMLAQANQLPQGVLQLLQ